MSEQKSPPSTADKAFQELVAAGLESMSSAAAAINQTVQNRIRTISEAFFLNELLPIVRDWVSGRETAEAGLWMNIADGINNPIRIADESGAIVAILPPPFIATPTADQAPTGRRFTTVHQIVQRQADSLNNGDARTVMEIENELISIFSPQAGDQAKALGILNLAKIYRRYNLPMEELFGDNAGAIVQRFDALEALESAGTTQPTTGTMDRQDDNREEQFIY